MRVGITGGIGSGKSTIARAFAVLGAPVFDADREGKIALNEEPELIEQVKTHFGPELYGPDGLDRKRLASMVFQDEWKLSTLNQLVHPIVRRRFREWCQDRTASLYVIEEAAILIESEGHRALDHLILVTAPERMRIQRVMERDGIDEEKVRARMEKQWTDEQKAPYADTILPNDDSELLLPRILELDERFRGEKGKL
jgi:dephospho-CoA kinase